MHKHPNLWLDDGSIIIISEDVMFRLYHGLISRLSPQFLIECCVSTKPPSDLLSSELLYECFMIRPESQISKQDFEALASHLLHDIVLSDDAPFDHLLRLYIASSPSRGAFEKVFREASKHLSAYMAKTPLEIDFEEYDLLRNALKIADLHTPGGKELKSSLRRALYYSYTTHDAITFEDGASLPSSESPLDPTQTESNAAADSNHITGSDAILCSRLMSQLSEHFSPTLFQPPAALHMECTDVYASLWMERAVQPAFTDNGTADPFKTLRRLRALDWKREVESGAGGESAEREEPCDECREHMKKEWSDEADSIWEKMDFWLDS